MFQPNAHSTFSWSLFKQRYLLPSFCSHGHLSLSCWVTINAPQNQVVWPSGPRRWIKAPVAQEAWVQIPPLPMRKLFGTCMLSICSTSNAALSLESVSGPCLTLQLLQAGCCLLQELGNATFVGLCLTPPFTYVQISGGVSHRKKNHSLTISWLYTFPGEARFI